MLNHESIEAQNGRGETVTELPSERGPVQEAFRRRARRLAVLALFLVICFARTLYDLAMFTLHSSLYSHILLIPLISLYLIWGKRKTLPQAGRPAGWLGGLPFLAGFGMLAGYWLAVQAGWQARTEDYLAVMTLSFMLLMLGSALVCLGTQTLRPITFPVAFLLFLVPFPQFLHDWVTRFLQRGSADASHALFWLSGTPVFRQGMAFQLPAFSLEVAPQCCGIHSSLILLITSVLAGYLFLRTPCKRAVLTLAVIPLAMLRNGFRIFTIGMLCVHVSPDMINSPIHRHGGPLFFALSLIPFLLLLLILRRSELKAVRYTA